MEVIIVVHSVYLQKKKICFCHYALQEQSKCVGIKSSEILL